MKKIGYLLVIAVLFSSCGEESSVSDIIAKGDIKAIREKKAAVQDELHKIEAQIKALDSAIGVKSPIEKFPLVTTITANAQNFNHYLEIQGQVMTKQNVLIYPEMPGTLQRVYVTEGQKVTKGQLLATIDDGGMSSQLAQLKTQAALAKTTFERQERLWKQNIGSEIQYLQAKTQYEATESSIKQVQSQLGKSSIRAPFSGIIDDVIKDQGTVVAPGMGSEVFRIVNLTNMYVDVEVPETYLGQVAKGKEAVVYFPVLGDSVVTKVRETGNFIETGNRSFSAEIPVPNKKGLIKPNLTARVKINDYNNPSAIIIPQSIISENAEGEQYVYVATKSDDKKAVVKRVIITTGKTQGSGVEIISGITNGDLLVKEGARSVKDNQTVQIL